MKHSEEFRLNDFAGLPAYPEPHTDGEGGKLPPDGDAQPLCVRRHRRPDMLDSRPIGLSYPEGEPFGPYVQHCGEGLAPTFGLDFRHSIPFSAGNIHPHTALLLFSLVLNQRPMAIVETGTFYGYSTWFMAEALRILGDGGKIHTIDTVAKLVAPEVLNHPNVEFHRGVSLTVMETLLPELGEVQFAFLDSYKRLSLLEFSRVTPLIPEGGMVAFHDTQLLNTGQTLVGCLKQIAQAEYYMTLWAGLPHKDNPHRYFGNADDRGLMLLTKRMRNPWLDVADAGTEEMGHRQIAEVGDLYAKEEAECSQ